MAALRETVHTRLIVVACEETTESIRDDRISSKEGEDYMHYPKKQMEELAEELLPVMRKTEDGEEFATRDLLIDLGYDTSRFDDDDLTNIHYALLKAVEKEGMTVEFSMPRIIGCPFEDVYVLHRPVCPYCGSRDIAWILYGYPVYTEELQKELEEGKAVLGGCMIKEKTHRCNTCGKDFQGGYHGKGKDMSGLRQYRCRKDLLRDRSVCGRCKKADRGRKGPLRLLQNGIR